jgi:hypothetical protein
LWLTLLGSDCSDIGCWHFVNQSVTAQNEAITGEKWYQPRVNGNPFVNPKRPSHNVSARVNSGFFFSDETLGHEFLNI